MKNLIVLLSCPRAEYSISDIFDRQKWIFPPTVKLSDFLTRDYDRQTKIFFDHVMELKILYHEIEGSECIWPTHEDLHIDTYFANFPL